MIYDEFPLFREITQRGAPNADFHTEFLFPNRLYTYNLYTFSPAFHEVLTSWPQSNQDNEFLANFIGRNISALNHQSAICPGKSPQRIHLHKFLRQNCMETRFYVFTTVMDMRSFRTPVKLWTSWQLTQWQNTKIKKISKKIHQKQSHKFFYGFFKVVTLLSIVQLGIRTRVDLCKNCARVMKVDSMTCWLVRYKHLECAITRWDA